MTVAPSPGDSPLTPEEAEPFEGAAPAEGDASAAAGPLPLWHPERFAETLDALPEPLRGAMAALEPYVLRGSRRRPIQAVYAPLRLGVDAWEDGELFAAHFLLLQAAADPSEGMAAEPDAGPAEVEGPPFRGPGGFLFPGVPGPFRSGGLSVHAYAPGPDPDAPVFAATDAGWNGKVFGYGYVVSTGLWGMRSSNLIPRNATGAMNGPVDSSTIHELRAVAHLMRWLPRHLPDRRPVTLLCDNLNAQRYLRKWRLGEIEQFPAGEAAMVAYDRDDRSLEWLAHKMAENTNVQVADVNSHTGHLLNEAADSLTAIARRRTEGTEMDHITHAGDLVAHFLTAWANGDESRFGSARRPRRGRHVFTELHHNTSKAM